MRAKQLLSLGLCGIMMATNLSFASVTVDAVTKATEETTAPAKVTTTPAKTTTAAPAKTATTTTPAKTATTPAKATTTAPAKATTTTAPKPAVVEAVKTYSDGVYRGVFIDGAEMQVNVDFELKANQVVTGRG